MVAEILVEADLLGYSTHGLQFVPAYMKGLEGGKWTTSGAPEIVTDNAAALVIDGNWLPGQWVMVKTLETCMARMADHPVVTATVKRSHNISCLATYCKRAAEAGYLAIVAASAPGNAVVAPAGGRAARLATSPFAAGIPAPGHPILFDTATSSTTNRAIERARREGDRLAFPALVNAEGEPTDDPNALYTDPPGAILPMGGMDTGHKGYALSLLIEALTSGLSGFGRAPGDEPGDEPAGGNTVFIQLTNPAAFGGAQAFSRETGFLAEICRTAPAMDDDTPVRVPGDRAFALYRDQTANGVELHPEIMPRMAPLLEKYGIAAPAPL